MRLRKEMFDFLKYQELSFNGGGGVSKYIELPILETSGVVGLAFVRS
jgi:hypothetical protein